MVTVLLSPSANAVFTVLWMVVVVALIIPSALATVLFPVIQAEPHQYRNRINLSLGVSLLYTPAFGLFIFLLSTDILGCSIPLMHIGQQCRRCRNSKIKFDSGALSCISAKLIMQSLANGKVFYYADAH
jgi:hypothetical protein